MRIGIAIKIERTQIHFSSDVLKRLLTSGTDGWPGEKTTSDHRTRRLRSPYLKSLSINWTMFAFSLVLAGAAPGDSERSGQDVWHLYRYNLCASANP